MDKNNIFVKMTMKDYEELEGYQKSYKQLMNGIKTCGYIDSITTNNATIVISSSNLQVLLFEMLPSNCEFEHLDINDVEFKFL